MTEQNSPQLPESGTSFWTSLPVILAGLTALVGAVAGLIAVWPGPDSSTTTTAPTATTSTVPTATTSTAATAQESTTTTAEISSTVPVPPETTTTTTEPPLHVVVEADPGVFLFESADRRGFSYVFPLLLGQVGGPPSDDCNTWYDWARELDGADNGDPGTMFQITLTGKTEDAVVINGFDVKVVDRDPPIHDGVAVICVTGGAEFDPRHISVKLDSEPNPEVRYLRPEGDQLVETDLNLSVTNSDPEVLEVRARTELCDCHWIGVLHYIAGGESGSIEITNDGMPFRTSGARNSKTYRWSSESQDWVEHQN